MDNDNDDTIEDILDDSCLSNSNTNKSITNCTSFKRINATLICYKKWMEEQYDKKKEKAKSNTENTQYQQQDNGFYDILLKINSDNNYNMQCIDDFHHLLHTFISIFILN